MIGLSVQSLKKKQLLNPLPKGERKGKFLGTKKRANTALLMKGIMMTVLCFGTFSRLLKLTTSSYAMKSFEKMGTELLKALMEYPNPNEGLKIRRNGHDEDYYDESVKKLVNCRMNVIPEIKAMLQAKDVSEIREHLKKHLFPAQDRNQMRRVVACLQKLIEEDASIPPNTSFYNAVSKEQFLTKTSFTVDDFFTVLTGVFCYSLMVPDNTGGKSTYKNINKDFVESCKVKADSIGIYEPENRCEQSLDADYEGLITTSNKDSFEDAFIHLHTFKPSMIDISEVKVYCHPFDEKDFDYEKLNECLLENIGFYIYSRSKVQESFSGNKMSTLAHKAIKAIIHLYPNKEDLAKEIEKIMVYLALEQAYDAPKLFVSTEMKELSHQYSSVSSGVHIKSRTTPWPALQLVFSTAIIEGDLKHAIESSLDQISVIAKNRRAEKRKVEENVMNLRLFDESNEKLEKILLSSGNVAAGLETAFGALIGYTTSAISRTGKSVGDYQAEKVQAIKQEIISMEDFITETIQGKELEEYSIYFFFIPFDEAEVDRMTIVEDLLC